MVADVEEVLQKYPAVQDEVGRIVNPAVVQKVPAGQGSQSELLAAHVLTHCKCRLERAAFGYCQCNNCRRGRFFYPEKPSLRGSKSLPSMRQLWLERHSWGSNSRHRMRFIRSFLSRSSSQLHTCLLFKWQHCLVSWFDFQQGSKSVYHSFSWSLGRSILILGDRKDMRH